MNTRSLVLLLTAATASVAAQPGAALADSPNAAATQAYVQANYALVQAARSHVASAEASFVRILRQVRQECPAAAAESPEDTDAEQLSDEVVGTMVLSAIRPYLQPIRTFIRKIEPLRWSNHGLTSAIKAYAGKLTSMSTLAVPALCADVKAWTASGFQTLPATTVRFDQRFMSTWVASGELPASLTAYESPQERALARRSHQIEVQLTEFEARGAEPWGDILDALDLNP